VTALLAGRYQLVRRLDQAGTVWQGRDQTLHRDVTLRQVEPGEVQALRTVSRARHPSLLVVHDVLTDGGQAWSVTELTDGVTLADLPRPTETQAADIGADILGALAAAHALGVVHGGVEPRSVVRTLDGRLKLTGFGTPRPHELFRPPEAVAVPASDVWGVAATLTAVAEGRPAFGSPAAIQARQPPLPPIAAPRLGAVLQAALAPDPAARPSADAVRRRLRALAPAAAPPAHATEAAPRRPLRVHPGVLAAAAAVWVAVVAAGAVTLSLPPDRSAGQAVDGPGVAGPAAPGRNRPLAAAPAPCSLLTAEQLRRLVPDPDQPVTVRPESCSWRSVIDSQVDLPYSLQPSLGLEVELKDDPKAALDLDRRLGGYTGSVRELHGLGDDAFITSWSLGSSARKPYTVEVHFRTANAVVTLKYDRLGGGPDRRMDASAEQGARWVATALSRG
jgi:hypothetical protein